MKFAFALVPLVMFSLTLAADPVAGTTPSPQERRAKADSVWIDSRASLALHFYTAPLQFGSLVDVERGLIDNVGIQNYEFELQAWFGPAPHWELGLGIGHAWLLEVGGNGGETPGIGALASTNSVVARGRLWLWRDRKWELGPQVGLGYAFGTVNRLVALEKVSPTIRMEGMTQAELEAAQRPIDVAGPRAEIGMAMEVQLNPHFSLGGVLQLAVQAWDGDDPVVHSNSQLRNGGFGNTAFGPQLHLAYRF